ncbi:MAG TPA: hypothetical protein VFC41_04770, partial [Anaerovoracaceae bacterium]|nr:hypothetical protein [Anaerovoracaceae bacterium]
MQKLLFISILLIFNNILFAQAASPYYQKRKTTVSISGEKFLINGIPTFHGKSWKGYPLEGLLPNSRMVQGIFDDLN